MKVTHTILLFPIRILIINRDILLLSCHQTSSSFDFFTIMKQLPGCYMKYGYVSLQVITTLCGF